MIIGLYIFLDDDYDDPIYADPPADELDGAVWQGIVEALDDAWHGEGDPRGSMAIGEALVGWRCLPKAGLSFVAVVSDDVKPQHVEQYLKDLGKRYLDEVDDIRHPERDGVEDVVVDVIPPWEDPDD